MYRLAFLCILGLMSKSALCLPVSANGFVPTNSVSPNMKPFSNTINEGNSFLANPISNYANSILANEVNANGINNMATGMITNVPISNIEVTPYISEVVPSLQYGDINMAGELPIGGTIRVSGCFPVYGSVAVEGNLPSTGTAVVAESFGNQVIDVVNKCANQYFN